MLPSSRLYLRDAKELRRGMRKLHGCIARLAYFRQRLGGMANRSLDERVAFLERSMGGKTLEEHFREHAELIDRRFAEVHARFTEIHARFTAQDKRFEAMDRRFETVDARFVSIDAQFVAVHARFDAMDERFNRVDHELGFIRRDVGLILQKLNA